MLVTLRAFCVLHNAPHIERERERERREKPAQFFVNIYPELPLKHTKTDVKNHTRKLHCFVLEVNVDCKLNRYRNLNREPAITCTHIPSRSPLQKRAIEGSHTEPNVIHNTRNCYSSTFNDQ